MKTIKCKDVYLKYFSRQLIILKNVRCLRLDQVRYSKIKYVKFKFRTDVLDKYL